MGFDARYVSNLDYDFTATGLPDIKGVSPDPTDDEVYQFQLDMSKAAEVLGQDFDPNDQEAMMEFMRGLSREDFRRVSEHTFTAIDKMLHGQPSKEELTRVAAKNHRHAMAYQGSLMGDIMDPKLVKKLISKD